MDEVTARPILNEREITEYMKSLHRRDKYHQIDLIKEALVADKYESGSPQIFLTYFENRSIGEYGHRLDYVYPPQENMQIIIHSFDGNQGQETIAYVINGNDLMFEYFTNDDIMKSNDDKKFIKNNWNGDMILSTRTREEYQPWQM